MNNGKLKIGIIGLGRISPRHIEDSISQIKELELAAVCDIDKKLAQASGQKHNVAWYTKYEDLIKDKNVDVVSICTPNGWHYPMGLAVAKANKHCVMEKPISLIYKDGKKLVNAFKNSQGLLFPVLQVRYNPVIRVVKDYVDKHYLGKVLTAAVVIRWNRPQEYFDKSEWHGTKKMDGGTLLTQGIHYIDAMQFILGPAKTVFAKTGKVAHKIEVEDITNAILDLRSGARVNLEFTVCTYPHNLECSLTILGEKGTIKIGGLAMNTCEIWEVANTPKPIFPEGIAPNQYAGGMYVGSCPNHFSIYQNLVDVIIHKQPSFIYARDALESLRIIDGIRHSNATKKELFL